MIKPMLAYKVGKKQIDYTMPVFLQPKLDGVRWFNHYSFVFVCYIYIIDFDSYYICML